MLVDAGSPPSVVLRPGNLILRGRTSAMRSLSSVIDALDDVFESRLDEGRNAVAAALSAFRLSKVCNFAQKASTYRDDGSLSLATQKLWNSELRIAAGEMVKDASF